MATEGCWIDVFEDSDFRGKSTRIEGPGRWNSMRFPSGDFGDMIHSVIVGPRAWPKAYEDENFTDDVLTLWPNQRIADLGEFKFEDEIDSLELFDHQP